MKMSPIAAAVLLLLNVGAHSFSQQTPSFFGFLRHDPDHGHEHSHPHGHHEEKHGHHAEEAEHGHHAEEGEHGEHGHHGEHAEHGEHGHHEHLSPEEEALEAESFSIALFLMGGVGALMFIFYLVNSPYLGIKVATWRVLNMTASIFVAVLLYGTLKMVVLHIFEPGFRATIAITLTMFIIFYVGTHFVLFKLKGGDEMQLQASSTILAHISGFAAMYGFADCQEVEMFEALDATGIMLLIVSAAAIISSLAYVMDQVMQKIANDDGVQDEAEEQWIDTCDETDDDVFCLAISFLCVLFFRYLIRGKVQPYEPGMVGDVTQADSNMLLCVAFGFLALVGAGTVVILKYQNLLSTNAFDRRITTNIQHLNSMIMAWCFLFWAEWQLYVWGWESTVIGGCLVVALFLTAFSFATVFVLNSIQEHFQDSKMAQRAMGSLELALGVLVGFSWERAFDVGFEEIEHTLEHRIHIGVPPIVAVTLMSLLLLVVVGPAWRYYILPKAAQMEAQEAKAES